MESRGDLWAALRARRGWLAVAVAVTGIVVCLFSLLGFLGTVVTNNLPWHPDQSVREHYQAVTQSYGQGFTVGFFLCFFLTMIAVSVDAWWRTRRRAPRPAAPEAAIRERSSEAS